MGEIGRDLLKGHKWRKLSGTLNWICVIENSGPPKSSKCVHSLLRPPVVQGHNLKVKTINDLSYLLND